MSNYPPGVTGNEYEIAGPDFEVEHERECPVCEAPCPGMDYGYRHDHWWVCDVCETQVDLDG